MISGDGLDMKRAMTATGHVEFLQDGIGVLFIRTGIERLDRNPRDFGVAHPYLEACISC